VKYFLGFELSSGMCVVLYGFNLLRTGAVLFYFHFTTSIRSKGEVEIALCFLRHVGVLGKWRYS